MLTHGQLGKADIISSCAINQGPELLYPIKAQDFNNLLKAGKVPNKETLEKTKQSDECLDLDALRARYIGFCTVMNKFFPEKGITNTTQWTLKINDQMYYKAHPDIPDAQLYYTV